MAKSSLFVGTQRRITVADRVYIQALARSEGSVAITYFPMTDNTGKPMFAMPGGGYATEAELRESCLAQTA
jgi:hypothetical protein